MRRRTISRTGPGAFARCRPFLALLVALPAGCSDILGFQDGKPFPDVDASLDSGNSSADATASGGDSSDSSPNGDVANADRANVDVSVDSSGPSVDARDDVTTDSGMLEAAMADVGPSDAAAETTRDSPGEALRLRVPSATAPPAS
jgi:hypothetical protein